MSAALSPAGRLDFVAVERLTGELRARRGADLSLDLSGVTHLGAAALQLFVSAARTWAEDGRTLSLDGASEAVAASAVALGLPLDAITGGSVAR